MIMKHKFTPSFWALFFFPVLISDSGIKGPEIEIWKQLMVILSIADPNYVAQLARAMC